MNPPAQGNPSKSEEQHGSVMINGEKYPLPEPVIRNIEKVIGLRANQERGVPLHERVLAKVAEAFGRPLSFYTLKWPCSSAGGFTAVLQRLG